MRRGEPFRDARTVVVDDHPANVLLLERILGEADYTAVMATCAIRSPWRASYAVSLRATHTWRLWYRGQHLVQGLDGGTRGDGPGAPRALLGIERDQRSIELLGDGDIHRIGAA